MPKTTYTTSGGIVGFSFNVTRYVALVGRLSSSSAEAPVQVTTYWSLTLANLFVRVTANTLDVAATVVSRVNAGNGNLTITIGAGLTGTFTDEVNTDALVNGDAFNTAIMTTGATVGSITLSLAACTLEHASTQTSPYRNETGGIVQGGTRYDVLSGFRDSDTEANVQYTVRFASTWTNLHVYVNSNNTDNASTVQTRINAANGNMNVSIPANTTGLFEDTVNTDALAAGDEVDHIIVAGVGAGGDLITPNVMSWIQASATDSALAVTSDGIGVAHAQNLTRYYVPMGQMQARATESETQLAVLGVAITGQNLIAVVSANTAAFVTTVRTRRNGANGNQTITVGAGLTGIFEDNVNTDAYAVNDTMNYQMVTVAGAGSVTFTIYGMEIVFDNPVTDPGGGFNLALAKAVLGA